MDKKQEAIELLKKETTNLANVYKKDGGFVLSGTYNNEKKETYNKEQREIKEIRVGDYFIARKPKQDAVLGWISVMDKFDGVIQECGLIHERGYILSKTTLMDMWCYLPEWCEKVSPGDVMKTGYGDLIIFKEFKNGKMYDYAFYSHNGGDIYIDQNIPTLAQPQLHISHTTTEEAKPLFDALAKSGKKWNREKLQIEDIKWEPKDGEFVTNTFNGGRTISIFCKHFIYEPHCENPTFLAYCGLGTDYILYFNDIFGVDKMIKSTPAEIKQLTDALEKQGKRWNAEKMCVEDITKTNADMDAIYSYMRQLQHRAMSYEDTLNHLKGCNYFKFRDWQCSGSLTRFK